MKGSCIVAQPDPVLPATNRAQLVARYMQSARMALITLLQPHRREAHSSIRIRIDVLRPFAQHAADAIENQRGPGGGFGEFIVKHDQRAVDFLKLARRPRVGFPSPACPSHEANSPWSPFGGLVPVSYLVAVKGRLAVPWVKAGL